VVTRLAVLPQAPARPTRTRSSVRSRNRKATTLGSRLVAAIVAWGDAEAIVLRVGEHHEAGADHVLIQPLEPDVDRAVSQLEDLAVVLAPG
jgi:hypothetical protein